MSFRIDNIYDLGYNVHSILKDNNPDPKEKKIVRFSAVILNNEKQEKVAVYENCMSQLKKFQDEQMAVVHKKFNMLDADFIKTCMHLEEKLYPHMLTTIVGRRWLLSYGMKLTVFKCLNSPKYLSALGAAIIKAIEKGMQDGLAVGITHGQEGRFLADDAAFRENIANNRSTLRDIFVLFSEPLSVAALEGTAGTSSVAPDITTALSVSFASASTIPPISMDDYEIAHAEDHGNAGADVNPFLNVDEAELIIS
ncbi:hypothetical protein Tco_1004620 [Tanacetum coccineum]|uniref:Uncharacterized protein n=1 Tax=Tanacetum coccineum TaxID=301880 RepID=A0ABQ5FEW0_9ASTR